MSPWLSCSVTQGWKKESHTGIKKKSDAGERGKDRVLGQVVVSGGVGRRHEWLTMGLV